MARGGATQQRRRVCVPECFAPGGCSEDGADWAGVQLGAAASAALAAAAAAAAAVLSSRQVSVAANGQV